MGGIWIAMRIAMASPQTPDCRGGVFAVFAKIPPPVLPRVLHGYKPWAYTPSSGQPARYLCGVEAGILSLPSEFCKSPLGAIFYGGAFPLWRVNGFYSGDSIYGSAREGLFNESYVFSY